MRCEATIRHLSGGITVCPEGCPATFKIQLGPLSGQWLWLCDRHLIEYRERGFVAKPEPYPEPPLAEPRNAVPTKIEFEHTPSIRRRRARRRSSKQNLRTEAPPSISQHLPSEIFVSEVNKKLDALASGISAAFAQNESGDPKNEPDEKFVEESTPISEATLPEKEEISSPSETEMVPPSIDEAKQTPEGSNPG